MIRIFGEPRKRPETEAAGTREGAQTPGDVTGGAGQAELIEELRERAKRAEKQAEEEGRRAARYEQERDELRVKYEEILTRLLPAPIPEPSPIPEPVTIPEKRSGWLRRVFGG